MAEANIVDAKYVFLDVVGFTRGRHVEAQAAIVEKLNQIVRRVLDQVFGVPEDNRILIPTGDGICIVLLGRDAQYDLHVQIALGILADLHAHNNQTEDEMTRCEVRIGVNANDDNLVKDINGNRNMAGAGINVAQRVMDSADGNQILVSTRVHEALRDRRNYMGSFRSYTATTKHGEQVPVHQLVKEGESGLNLDVPQAFRQAKTKESRLSKLAAYYLAHALRNHPVMVERRDDMYDDDAVIVLLRSLAEDSETESQATELEVAYTRTYKAGSATFWEQYEHYRDLDSYVISDLSCFIRFGNKDYLSRYSNCFAQDSFGLSDFRAVSDHGKRKLKQDWPKIWEELNLDTYGDEPT